MATKVETAGTDVVARARAAFERRAWSDAFAAFVEADAASPLAAADLEHLANAAHLLGRQAERDAIGLRAHQGFVDTGQTEGAARSAFWIGFDAAMRGEGARGAGWLARAKRLLDDAGQDSVVYGYLLLPQGIGSTRAIDPLAGQQAFEAALDIARRFGDPSLAAFARMGIGRSLIKRGHIDDGLALLDEVMAAVASGEVAPGIVGSVYCSVIDACHEVFDLHRAQEWTDELNEWCTRQPEVVPFRGQCLTHRAELMQFHGDWPDALDEARRACEWLGDPPGNRAAGPALYRCAELHRLRGSFPEAEASYRAASDVGRNPHPGLALLWLAQGKTDAAVGAVRRLLVERQPDRQRAEVLEAAITILLSSQDLEASRRASMELCALSARLRAPYLRAAAAQGAGAVLLAEGKPEEALSELRTAWDAWHDLGAPFEAARTRALIARAHRALGDEETAALELEAAGRALTALGAAGEVIEPDRPPSRAGQAEQTLTDREHEVLRLIASGRTNRAVAVTLGISEKTVARHVSNIFLKLDLSSRSAATAYAYEHRLLKTPT